jgi:hypothetical protein
MSFAPLPESLQFSDRKYDVIPLASVRWEGEELDALACHRTRQVFIARSAPPAVQAAALEQIRHETSLLLLTAGPVASVA